MLLSQHCCASMGSSGYLPMADGFGKYDVYATAGSIYCYPDSNVLKNRFGLSDPIKLKAIETDLSAIRQQELLENPVQGHFSASHLCHIHQRLFGDIYPFAGHFRREDIMKGTTRFLAYGEIKTKLTTLLRSLHEESCLRGLSQEQFIERSAYYFAELNYIHPFREGNGRTTREFMRQLFNYNGYNVYWDTVSVEDLLSAMEESVYHTSALQKVLSACLIPTESK